MVHNVFSNILKKDVCSSGYMARKSKKMASWFRDTNEPYLLENTLTQITLSPEKKKEITTELKEFFVEKKRLQGFRSFHTFLTWWKAKQDVYLSLPVLQNAMERDLTLGEFVDELQLAFLEDLYGHRQLKGVSRFFHRTLQHPLLFAVSLTAVFIIHRIVGFAWSLMILGPGVQMVNSYSQPVITPMAQTAAQTGARDLAGAASVLQGWLSNRKALQSVSHDLHVATQDLSKVKFSELTREETKKKWAQFERTYFELFQRLNQALPSHLRDGRSFYRDWMLITPVTLSAHLSTFDAQYWIHKRDLEELRKRVAHRSMTTSEKAQVKIHEEQLAAVEDRMSATLAAWKIYEFMFPEFTQEAVRHQGGQSLLSTYDVLVESLHFDLYVKNFSGKVTALLKQMDAQFLMHDIQVESEEASDEQKIERRIPLDGHLHAKVGASVNGAHLARMNPIEPKGFWQSLGESLLPKVKMLRR